MSQELFDNGKKVRIVRASNVFTSFGSQRLPFVRCFEAYFADLQDSGPSGMRSTDWTFVGTNILMFREIILNNKVYFEP